MADADVQESKPPVFVQSGKRLSFDRRDEYTGELGDTFAGSGKSEGSQPTCSWEELCALAALVVAHPAFVPVTPTDSLYPPTIEDEPEEAER